MFFNLTRCPFIQLLIICKKKKIILSSDTFKLILYSYLLFFICMYSYGPCKNLLHVFFGKYKEWHRIYMSEKSSHKAKAIIRYKVNFNKGKRNKFYILQTVYDSFKNLFVYDSLNTFL